MQQVVARVVGLRHPADVRQLGIITAYMLVLASMVALPICRNPLFVIVACYLSFLNAVVIHNSLHRPPFKSGWVNSAWRLVLSFGNLYPASANIPSHNLVHHFFDDEGNADWAAPDHVRFKYNLLNLIHFPNVSGPNTFDGVSRWARRRGRARFRRQYRMELVFAFGLTGALLLVDFWTALLCVVIPQLWGARCILRINLIQHQGADTTSRWNHSRNFVGRAFNWIMCNNGYHTIHHNKPALHWSVLHEVHEREVVPRIDPRLDEPSMVRYLLRTFLLGRITDVRPDVTAPEQTSANVEASDMAAE